MSSKSAPETPIEKKAENAAIAQVKSFIAGGAGGVCAVVVGHPFDLVKVRLQTAERGVYSGAMDVVRKTIAREGLARVYINMQSVLGGHVLSYPRVFTPVFLLRWLELHLCVCIKILPVE